MNRSKLGFRSKKEQQEDRKISFCRSRQSSSMSKPNSSIPLDLLSEILIKLPAKSIRRLRCVSKLWSSITTDPYFINAFETRSSTNSSFLMVYKKLNKLFVFSSPQNNQNSKNKSYSSQNLDSYQMNCPKDIWLSSLNSVHGLICFQNSATPIIWNPTMKQFLTLPKPETSKKYMRSFLGYDPIEGKHKVVSMDCDECWVLTLGSSSWRRIKASPYNYCYGQGHCINGVIYCDLQYDHEQHSLVNSFDVRSETFQLIKLPWDIDWDLRIVYEGRLAFVRGVNQGKSINMLVLEDAEKGKWVEKSFRAPFELDDDQGLKTKFKLRGATEDGEFIYLPITFLESSFCILYFDLKRDSFRKVEFDGIADEEYRISTGLRVFPSHIDSLLSL